MIGVSAHSVADVDIAEAHGADFAVFGPVFEKNGNASHEGLKSSYGRFVIGEKTAQPPMPVLALGGITLENGAAVCGGGGGRDRRHQLFEQNDVVQAVVKEAA